MRALPFYFGSGFVDEAVAGAALPRLDQDSSEMRSSLDIFWDLIFCRERSQFVQNLGPVYRCCGEKA
jgi:hypothetical protein